METSLKKILQIFASPLLLTYLLPIVMIYLIAGTIAQKYIGLYDATQLFFTDPILWLGPIPLPGFSIILLVITFSIAAKIVLKSPWRVEKAGTLIIHISVFLLLFGGVITALTSKEAYLDLAPGETRSYVSDYHQRVLAILDNNQKEIYAIPHNDFQIGKQYTVPNLPITLHILETCRHCKISARQEKDETYMGMAQHMQLSPDKPRKESEENLAGLTFKISGSDQDGTYLTLENIPQAANITINDRAYTLVLRRERRNLPFNVELIEFERQFYPGTELAQSYQSRIRLSDGNAQWESLISMNEPLRYKGYSLYQSSFFETSNGTVSVLAVVANKGQIFPYLSGALLCFGLLVHLFLRQKKSVTIAATLFFFMLFGQSSPSHAQNFDLDSFGKLPIQHQGRIKPIESYAAAHLKYLSGSDKAALPWLIETLFNPALAERQNILKIRNRDVLHLLGIKPRANQLFSYQEITAALNTKQEIILSILSTPEEDWSQQHRDLITLQQKTVSLGHLLGSLSLFLPLSTPLPDLLPSDIKTSSSKTLTFLEALKFRTKLDQRVKNIAQEKKGELDRYNDAEKTLATLSFTLNELQKAAEKNDILRVIPGTDDTIWHAPWTVILQGKGSPETRQLFKAWQRLALAYHAQNYQIWQQEILNIKNETSALAYDQINPTQLKLEYHYQQLDPFYISALLYGAALLMLIGHIFWQKPFVIKLASAGLWAGFTLHLLGVLMRIYILDRPPVSTLYESILFVGVITVLFGLTAFHRYAQSYWLYLVAIGGVFLHLIGFSHNQEGDSFLMLTAVLNTNFWLATHVICITAGYAFCLICSLLGHYMLIKNAWDKQHIINSDLFHHLQSIALFALLFSAVGTVLGGIWADQSWGRFWGWDPKENGALLIVLWLVWFIHGKIAGQMNRLWVCAGLAYLSVIVALSWFGVNLLNVGLHSYGFTDGIAVQLGIFVLGETLFIGSLLGLIHHKQKIKP